MYIKPPHPLLPLTTATNLHNHTYTRNPRRMLSESSDDQQINFSFVSHSSQFSCSSAVFSSAHHSIFRARLSLEGTSIGRRKKAYFGKSELIKNYASSTEIVQFPIDKQRTSSTIIMLFCIMHNAMLFYLLMFSGMCVRSVTAQSSQNINVCTFGFFLRSHLWLKNHFRTDRRTYSRMRSVPQ